MEHLKLSIIYIVTANTVWKEKAFGETRIRKGWSESTRAFRFPWNYEHYPIRLNFNQTAAQTTRLTLSTGNIASDYQIGKPSTKQGGRSPRQGVCWPGTQQEPNLFSSSLADSCPTLGRTPNREGEENCINKLKTLTNSCSGINI